MICDNRNKEYPSHFFYKGVCIPCASSGGATAQVETKKDYEEIEDKGCASGACTLQ